MGVPAAANQLSVGQSSSVLLMIAAMRQLPPLAAVRAFEAAARLLHFTRAADELGMTQAAVSYQVKLLEERLGTALFQRTGRGVVLTPMGERIAPLVTAAFNGIDDAFRLVRREAAEVLVVSTSNSVATNWLAGRLGAFQLAHPKLAVQLQVQDAYADLERGDADIAIRTVAAPGPGLQAHFLMRAACAPFASPAFLARHPAPRDVAELLALPRLSPEDIWWQLWSDAVGGPRLEQGERRGIRLDSQVLEGNAAIGGHGLAILNPALWRAAVDAGQLVRAWPEVAFDRVSYWLVYPHAQRNAAKLRAFRDWVLAEFARDAASDPDGQFVPPLQDARLGG